MDGPASVGGEEGRAAFVVGTKDDVVDGHVAVLACKGVGDLRVTAFGHDVWVVEELQREDGACGLFGAPCDGEA